MQLASQRSIRAAVTAMTAALLGPAAARAADSSTLDSSILVYSETNRVKLAEGVFDLTRVLSERRTIGVRLTLDALTGATPNGATPSSHVQTFTGPSGSASYSAPPGEVPLDNTFTDQRIAVDGRLIESLDRVTFLNVGGHLSLEHDYTSFGVNGGIKRDFNRRNTTLGVALSYNHDIVQPIGGAPVPFAMLPPPGSGDGEGEDEGEGEGSGPGKGKDVVDAVFSATQVLGRNTLARANYSFSRSSGYLTDPYKILSVVQGAGGPEPGEPVAYVYENRPGARSMQSVFGEVRRFISGSVLDLSYRYFWDDWGIRSNTADASLRFPIGGGRSLEPSARWYHQAAADFHTWYLLDGQSYPAHASADARLAEFTGYTYGLQFLMPAGTDGTFRISTEYYTQKGARSPPDAVGILGQYDLFPALDVFMLRFGYAHDF